MVKMVLLNLIALLPLLSLVSSCCQNLTKTDAMNEIENLDKFHKEILKKRILARFGVSHPPARARLWRKRRDHGQGSTNDNNLNHEPYIVYPEEPQAEFDVHLMGHVNNGKGVHCNCLKLRLQYSKISRPRFNHLLISRKNTPCPTLTFPKL